MVLPNESNFFNMAKISSTPCIGRSFVSMEDENTCDMQLFLSNKKDDDSFFIPPPLTGHTNQSYKSKSSYKCLYRHLEFLLT